MQKATGAGARNRAIGRMILGKSYELSVVSVTPQKARALNKKYRKKSYTPDVLAFPLSKNEGEIVLARSAIAREAKLRKIPVSTYATYLLVHACLHLKGFTHGKNMAQQEIKFLKRLGIKDTSFVR